MAAFVLSLREGLEASLIVSILLGALRRAETQESKGVRAVWLGTFAAGLASILLAVGITVVGTEFGGRGEALFEGVTLLLAAVVLTWMIFWMQSQGRTLRVHLTGEVQRATHVTRAADGPANWNLFLVAFLAVFREGVELALFLAAAVFATSAGQTLTGALLGLAAAIGLGTLLFAGTVRLSLRGFFQITSVLLILFAAGMAARGVHELVEAGLLPGVVQPLWDTGKIVGEDSALGQLMSALVGYSSDPSLTEVTVYVAYFVVLGISLWFRNLRSHRPGSIPMER